MAGQHPRGARRALVALVALVSIVVLPAPAAGVVADPVGAELRAWLEAEGPLMLGWPDFPPMASTGEDGSVEGYGVDTWDLAALRLGVELEHVVVGSVDEVVAAFRDGRVDVIGGAGDRPDLREDAVRTRPYAHSPTGPVVLPERLPELAPSLAGATVTTVPGSPLVERVAALYPEATYVEVDSVLDGVARVERGEIDAIHGPYPLLGALAGRGSTALVPFGEPDSVVPVAGVGRPGAPATALLSVLRGSVSDGELSLLHVRWTGFDLSDPDADGSLPGWVLPVVLTVVGVLLVALLFVVVLRRRVADATTELRSVNETLEDRVEERTAELRDTADRLLRSNQALSRFSTTAAHDLKSPIAAIAGLSSVLQTVELPTEQREDLLGRISQSALRLGTMVDSMLEDARAVGARAGALEGEAFREWLREVCDPELTVVGGRLELDVEDGPIDADAEVLRRAVVNLVTNAAKYAVSETGLVVVVRLARAGDVWQLTVEDDGPGIPRPLWSEIFDRGRRLVEDDRGHGIGLAAVRDLVQGAGGSIRVGDADGGGARFTVVLPAAVTADATPPAAAEVSPAP